MRSWSMTSTRLRQLQKSGEANMQFTYGCFPPPPPMQVVPPPFWWRRVMVGWRGRAYRTLVPGRQENAWFGQALHSFIYLSPYLTFLLTTVLEIQGNIFWILILTAKVTWLVQGAHQTMDQAKIILSAWFSAISYGEIQLRHRQNSGISCLKCKSSLETAVCPRMEDFFSL